jgi:hypothetical protein
VIDKTDLLIIQFGTELTPCVETISGALAIVADFYGEIGHSRLKTTGMAHTIQQTIRETLGTDP